MSIEFVQSSSIKEEEYLSDSEIAENGFHIEPFTKCGEMFMDRNNEHFTFVCAFCSQPFERLSNFGQHLHKCRTSPKLDLSEGQLDMEDDGSTDLNHVDIPKAESDTENGQDIEDNADLIDPIKLEDGNETYNSGEDQPTFFEEESLQKDTISKNKSEKAMTNNKLCCFSCGKLFVTKATLRSHYRTVHPDMIEIDKVGLNFAPKIPSEMSCTFCLKTFHDPTIYHSHMEFDHIDKTYFCNRCPSTFMKCYMRDNHLDKHDGIKRYQCSQCPAQFSSACNRAKHVDYVHRQKKNLKKLCCRFCDRTFGLSSSLEIHERTHTKERPFMCEECGRSYTSRAQLTVHQRRHQNIKRNKCTKCDKAFFNVCDLKSHMVTHTNERPFSCNICERKFRSKAIVRAHKLLHLENKRFKCNICGKMFAQQGGLYSHMRSHNDLVSWKTKKPGEDQTADKGQVEPSET